MVPASAPRAAGAVGAIVTAMRDRTPETVDRVQKRIRAEIAFYAAEDVVRPDDLRASLVDNLGYVLGGLTGTGRADLTAAQATGRARAAQGAPLVEMLAAYRLGFAEIWAALVATARTIPGMDADVLVELAGSIFTLQNEYSDAAANGYRDEAYQIMRDTERERAALVEAILVGTAAKGTLWDAAQALRLPLDGTFLVVAAETVEVGHDPLPRIEPAIAALDVSSVWRLQPELLVGVVSLPRRTRVDAVLTVLRRHTAARVGVSPVFAELRQAAWGLRLARLALDRLAARPGLEQFVDSPLNVLVAAAPHAALDAAKAVLSGVLELPPDDRDLLLSTFVAWLDADGSATAAGAALFCHPNTVRYRMRRIEACTGRSLSRPSDVAELVTAVRAWLQLPHPD